MSTGSPALRHVVLDPRAKARRAANSRTPRAKRATAPKKRAAGEGALWKAHEPTARAAIDFWNAFLFLRMGQASDRPLDAAALERLAAIMRAVSWVESKHGTATTNQGRRDPTQCGHPHDAWWRQVIRAGGPGQDRFITGPGGSNFWAGDLPEAAERTPGLPAAARITGLANQALGHDDPAFNATLSYFWGLPFLIHKINTTAGKPTFSCGDLARDRLIDGAVAYNGGGDPRYRVKIVEALSLSGALPLPPKARTAAISDGPGPSVSDLVGAIASVLAGATRSRRRARITAATLRFPASHGEDGWVAAPLADLAGESAIVVTLKPPFESGSRERDAEDLEPVVEAVASLLDDLSGTAARMSVAVELPLELGWREGSVTVSLTTAAAATHTLLLAVERQAGR